MKRALGRGGTSRSRRWMLSGGAAAIIAGGAFVAATQPSHAAFPGRNGLIVFSSNRPATDGSIDFEIYSMRADGSDIRQLTNNTEIPPSTESGGSGNGNGGGESEPAGPTPIDDTQPAVSPDGTQIAFVSNRPAADGSSDSEIYIMNIDGTNVRQVTNDRPGSGSGNDYEPAWSPDGKQIVYRHGDGRMADLYIVNLASGHETQLVTPSTTGPSAYDGQPSWSPDGNEVAFRKGMGTQTDIWVYDRRAPQGADLHPLIHDAAVAEAAPSFSPDGKQLVFVRGDEGSGGGIWVANADGTGAKPLTQPEPNAEGMVYTDSAPRWSPDGTKIIFQSTRHGFLRPPETEEGTEGGGTEGGSGNGNCGGGQGGSQGGSQGGGEEGGDSFDAGNVELYVMNADGSAVTRLTSDPSTSGPKDQNPDWQTIPIPTSPPTTSTTTTTPTTTTTTTTTTAPPTQGGKRVAARMKLQLREFICGQLLLWGSVEPRSDGEKVMIQRHVGSGWRTAVTARLFQSTQTHSAYWLLLGNLAGGTYRAYIAGNAAHFDGYSNTVVVRTRSRITLKMDRLDNTWLRLTGTAPPRHDGSRIRIQKQTTTGWRTIATPRLTKTTATSSGYGITLRLDPGRYRAYFVGDRHVRPSVSTTRIVRSTVRITLRIRSLANSRLEVSGTVSPRHDGRKVMLQRLTRTGWSTVVRVPLTATTNNRSRYAMTFRRLAPGRYRTFMYGDGAHRLGVSGTQVVRPPSHGHTEEGGETR